jgi:hypothetical protein
VTTHRISRIPRLATAAALLASSAAACGGQEPRTPDRPLQVTTRDSAGLRIVENGGDTPPATWRLADRPTVVFEADTTGSVSHALKRVGGYLVLDSDASVVSFHDAQGRHQRDVVGGAAGGPEYALLQWMGTLRGDSVGVWDFSHGTLTVLTPDLRPGRVLTVPGTDGPADLFVYGALPDGSLVAARGVPDEAVTRPAGKAWREEKPMVRVHPDGRVEPLGTLPGDAMYPARFPGIEGMRAMTQPTGPRTPVTVLGGDVWTGSTDRYELEIRPMGGAPRTLVRRPWTPRPFTDAEREAVVEGRLAQARAAGEDAERFQRDLLAQAPWPETIRVFHDAIAVRAGQVWVADHGSVREMRQRSRWSVFDAQGRWIADVTGPASTTVLDAGDEWALAIQYGSDHRWKLGLYTLER